MVACAGLVAAVLWESPGDWPRTWMLPAARIGMIAFTMALAVYIGWQKHLDDQRFERSVRNYYGVLRVYEERRQCKPNRFPAVDSRNHQSRDGTHGSRRSPDTTSYYGPKSGLGRAIRYFEQRPAVRVGMIGLGAGVTAAYGRSGDFFRFYEINPLESEYRDYLVYFFCRIVRPSIG